MAKAKTIREPKVHKSGKPRAMEADESLNQQQSPEEFAKEFFGDSGQPQEPQDGLPTLAWLKEQYTTKSAAIRYLTSLGHKPKVIAKHLGIRYQHARNVATTELKRGPNEDWRPKPDAHGLTASEGFDVTKDIKDKKV